MWTHTHTHKHEFSSASVEKLIAHWPAPLAASTLPPLPPPPPHPFPPPTPPSFPSPALPPSPSLRRKQQLKADLFFPSLYLFG